MAKNSIRDFSATAGSNTDIQSVNIDENCPASGINNAIRELMVDLKNVSTGAVNLETPAADSLTVAGDLTVDTSTLKVDSSNNRVGVGTASPAVNLDIAEDSAGVDAIIGITAGTGGRAQIRSEAQSDGTSLELSFHTMSGSSTSERLRIDSSGNVGIGTDAPTTYGDSNTKLAVVTPTSNANDVNIRFGTNDVKGIIFVNDVSGDSIGFGTTTNAPVLFNTNNTERIRIDSSGNVSIGTTNLTPAQSNVSGGLSYRPTAQLEVNGNNTQAAFFGRTNDGELIRFFSAGGFEGAITVSGSTVSYVGGHLSRWSQLADNTKDTSIVKGTVMTNLDQMAAWSHDEVLWTADDELPDGVSVGDVKTAAYTEDNEQLNCMAVSSVEGDPNVAGVFVNWDDDDEDFTADMNIAMTGDMVIRIASGTTVARGDLLMSAGDGTAKPQDDDIVRSKTIAKVTSTTVSHTYDDGSYLVPCVLMAC